MLGRRVKAFPKVLAIIESILKSSVGTQHEDAIIAYLEYYLQKLADDEAHYQYLVSWIAYFLVSNDLKRKLRIKPTFTDPIIRSVFNNRGAIFKDSSAFKLFEGARTAGRRVSMLEHLDVFNRPPST